MEIILAKCKSSVLLVSRVASLYDMPWLDILVALGFGESPSVLQPDSVIAIFTPAVQTISRSEFPYLLNTRSVL